MIRIPMRPGGTSHGDAHWQWIAMGGAVLAACLAAIVFVRTSPVTSHRDGQATSAFSPVIEVPMPIMRGRVTAQIADQSVRLPMAALVVGSEHSTDEPVNVSVPIQPPRSDLILPGQGVTQVIPGARFSGGSLYVSRRGQETALLADVAPAGEVRQIWANQDDALRGSGPHALTYEFQPGDNGAQMRALWKSSPTGPARPVVGAFDLSLRGAAADAVAQGLHLVQTRRCVACHRTDNAAWRSALTVPTAPLLTTAGDRLRADWMAAWLEDPQAIQPTAHMPIMFGDGSSAEARSLMDDVAAYLAAQSSPKSVVEDASAAGDPTRGEATYNEVGCLSCHGAAVEVEQRWSLDDVGDKYRDRDGLAGFLAAPLEHHPDGRMPGMRLTAKEAADLAAYLDDGEGTAEAVADAEQIGRGQFMYAAMRCDACHAVADPSASPPKLPTLEDIATRLRDRTSAAGVCTTEPKPGVPHFDFDEDQVAAIGAYFDSALKGSASFGMDAVLLAADIARMNCAACHTIGDTLGPSGAITSTFASAEEADLGDEGRIPPTLTDLGGRLNRTWIAAMLDGETVSRPWMKTRMPDFGTDNVARLPGRWCAVSGIGMDVDDGSHVFTIEGAAAIGREIVGSNGLNCIECHDIAGQPATGTPGPDLALAAERLRYEAFVRWLWDPSEVRPGTRMPTFFYPDMTGNRKSPLLDYYGGDARRQIDAMWAYLSQGENLALPEGLDAPSGTVLEVGDEPVVFRTFMKDAGVRAIAVGHPEGVHGAFDADRCATTVVWSGQFLDAAAAWVNRGGSATEPSDVGWSIPVDQDTIMTVGAEDMDTATAFDGYRLDGARRPVFMYRLTSDNTMVRVTEQMLPSTEGAMRIRYTFEGPTGTMVRLTRADRTVVDGGMEVGDRVQVTLNNEGRARLMLEVRP